MKKGRVALLFAFAFGAIILPVAVAFLVFALTAEPPFKIEIPENTDDTYWYQQAKNIQSLVGITLIEPGLYPGVQKGVKYQLDNGQSITILDYQNKAAASDHFHPVQYNIPTSSVMKSMGITTYKRKDNNLYGIIFADGKWLILSEALSKEQRINQLRDLSMLTPLGVKEGDTGEGNIKYIFTCILVYCIGYFIILFKMGSWAASIDRIAGSHSISIKELKNRLMSINDLDVPFIIKPGKKESELIAEWKYKDVKWAGLMAAGGMKSKATIRLRLDEKKNIVRAQDIISNIQWNAGGTATFHASVKASWFRGISFVQFDRGFVGGIIFEQNGKSKLSPGYKWSFNIAEMKKPLVETIITGGWDWRPVVTFCRIFS